MVINKIVYTITRSSARVHPLELSLFPHLLVLKRSRKGNEERGRLPTVGKNKGKTKVVDKGKCFHYNVDGHWKHNCSKYFVEKKKEKEGKYDTCFKNLFSGK